MKIKDMPKLHSPFIRKEIDGNYVVTPEIDPDYQWVFDEPAVKCIEKLDGTNASIVVENGKIVQVTNRTNKFGFWTKNPQFSRIVEGVLHANQKGWTKELDNGQYFGEALGDKIQANPLNIKQRLWIPFAVAKKKLMYKSFYKYDRTFENWSSWFKDYLFSLMARKYSRDKDKKVFAEGVVFYHPDGRMAKLRRDMFDWYKGKRQYYYEL